MTSSYIFENIHFRPFTRKREASVIKNLHSGERFRKGAFSVTVLTEYVWTVHSWTKVLGNFCISGVFSNSHVSNPSPHPTNNVGRVYPEFFSSFNFLKGGGRENCAKFSKRMHRFKREPTNNRRI